jgi:hypothetical protein
MDSTPRVSGHVSQKLNPNHTSDPPVPVGRRQSSQQTSLLHCYCGKTFTSRQKYTLHLSHAPSSPPAIIDEHINSEPIIDEERFISEYIDYCESGALSARGLKYSVYCLVGVPVHVYKRTPHFNVKAYMLDCLDRNDPLVVYIGKNSSSASDVAEHHTDPLSGFSSSVGKSIILGRKKWFHVRSEAFETLQQATKAEVLAQAFVDWRCHIKSRPVKWLPAWGHPESKQFRGLTMDEKFGLLKIYKDVHNIELFCVECLRGTCDKPHEKTMELFHGRPIIREVLFSGNWKINVPNLHPLQMK